MTPLAQQRIDFIALLHSTFILSKGHGAFAYVSIIDVLTLFEKFLDSNEPVNRYINRYVSSFE